MTSEHMIATI